LPHACPLGIMMARGLDSLRVDAPAPRLATEDGGSFTGH
jgi:hypothetical protein